MPKKPKLTLEEKKRLQEEKKLQKKYALAEANRQIKREALARELKYGELARKKLAPKWQKMMMDIKLPQLKTEFQQTQNNVELILDTKDYIISLLLDELDEAELQYRFNYRKHCENIQNIYKIYLIRLYDLKKDYDNDLLYLQHSLREQLSGISSEHEEAETDIKTMIYGLNSQEKYLENMGRSLYLSKQNEQQAKNTDELNLKRKRCEDRFENTWKSFTKVLEDYTAQIKETEKDLEERLYRDNAVVKIIKKQTEDIFQHYNTLRIVKDKQTFEKDNFNRRIEDLNDEINYLQSIFTLLRKTFIEDVKYDENMLTNLVVLSNKQIENMESYVNLAEKILKLYSIVRKYETKREKVLAFPKIEPKKYRSEHEWANLKGLTNFWQKCALADMTRNNVHDEYLQLLKEKCILKSTIKSCINYSCNRKLPPISQINQNILRAHSSTDIIYNV